MKKIRWGILSTAKIAREKLIPAMQAGQYCSVDAIASRSLEQAKKTAEALRIPLAYSSYEELLNDPQIDAIYIPLPNHLHLPWAIKSLEANKHVLCEKPIALSAAEACTLLDAADEKPHLKIMEAFMYRFHPQWKEAKKLVQEGFIGKLKTIQSFFSYYNTDAGNIRNQQNAGGGALMDIGCYCISLSRFIFDKEPEMVLGNIESDPVFNTDRITTGILKFDTGSSTFTCSTQLMPYQRVHILGSAGRIEIEIPFNAPPHLQTRLWLHTKNGIQEINFDAIDQYTIQADAFSKAILENLPLPVGLNDAVGNMKVIDAIFKSAELGEWISI
jgi:predicted dehydrogenase